MSTAQLQPEEREIVRKSILDRMSAKAKLIQFFDLNARAKHGVPLCMEPQNPIVIATTPKDPIPPTPEPPTPEPPTPTPTPEPPIPISPPDPFFKKVLIIASLVALGMIGLALLYKGITKEPSIQRQSPLQYLEDRGEHLP